MINEEVAAIYNDEDPLHVYLTSDRVEVVVGAIYENCHVAKLNGEEVDRLIGALTEARARLRSNEIMGGQAC